MCGRGERGGLRRMCSVRFWARVHLFLLVLSAVLLGLAAWAVRQPHHAVIAASLLLAASAQGGRAFGRAKLPPSKRLPALQAVVSALALAVFLWALGPGLWQWLHG